MSYININGKQTEEKFEFEKKILYFNILLQKFKVNIFCRFTSIQKFGVSFNVCERSLLGSSSNMAKKYIYIFLTKIYFKYMLYIYIVNSEAQLKCIFEIENFIHQNIFQLISGARK